MMAINAGVGNKGDVVRVVLPNNKEICWKLDKDGVINIPNNVIRAYVNGDLRIERTPKRKSLHDALLEHLRTHQALFNDLF